jgi:DNA-binding response OmpR family regulator
MISKNRTAAELPPRSGVGIHAPESPAGVERASGRLLPGSSVGAGVCATKTILVIDDDPDVRELVARTVTRAGFWAHSARDGEDGWAAFCHIAYDLVITDNEMPRLTGLSLIERIRSFSREPPCILISGRLPGVESNLERLVGPDAVLAKPFSPAALIERVYSLLLRGDHA